MTTVAVFADPPRSGLVLSRLIETSPISTEEAADLYGAMLSDVCLAVERSGGELLVNYRPDDLLPDEHAGGDAEAEIRDLLDGVLEEPPRVETQVGSTRAARVGNTVSHLLETEEVASAAVVTPTAPFCFRTHIDGAAMKLRNSPVVLGPATRGRVYFAGFTEPIDFEGAYQPPEIETLAWRASDAGLDTDFLPVLPVVETGADLRTVVSLIRARRVAERIVPPHTTEWIGDRGLRVEGDELVRED
ncbi:hypothetical protein [Halalkalicoccus sp. NIPERK01]|uniref:hypothetical protein n=1 Tax=Halalkalicoccus sp. NIPERK01 TaxID=3053469 RepID=UPI00256F442F|nr:hypothetical protein [Halalkalicoccus sp. NIPERK01]MDL5361231.1 hypothetical protein [Halalkalicoccus sp. NIPERK01]